MDNRLKFGIAAAIVAVVIVTSLPAGASIGFINTNNNTAESHVLRIGYFPNINHAQAVIGFGRGDFQKALDGIEVKTQVFNAGPNAITALFANEVDVTYIGPNPAINGYVQSDGEALRIISGAASGGAVFVVRNDAGVNSTADLANKKFASPQLGNTQDVALRTYLLDNGYKTKENGGSVEVIPAASNADIFTLMVKKEIDGAWVPEPWGAKLVKEANGKILVDERDLWPNGEFVTSHIIVRTDYLKNNPETIKKLLEANINETNWINEHHDEAVKVFNTELKKISGKTIPEDEFNEGFSRLKLTWDPIKESLFQSADDAFDIGFLGKTKPDLSKIYDLTLLNQVLEKKGLQKIE